jgi:hypothetical protein
MEARQYSIQDGTSSSFSRVEKGLLDGQRKKTSERRNPHQPG